MKELANLKIVMNYNTVMSILIHSFMSKHFMLYKKNI